MTIEQWLQELPEPVRSQALANMWWERAKDECDTLPNALHNAFLWFRSPERFDYWQSIYNAIA